MLTKSEILKQMDAGRIHIKGFKPEHLGANSYDVTLGDTFSVYKRSGYLDPTKANPSDEWRLNEGGMSFGAQPGELYLAKTNESTVSRYFVPVLYGRSSLARLGINIHQTAGFGDLGWGYVQNEKGIWECTFPTWTLEITVVRPTLIYPGMKIGQVAFHKPIGDIEHLYEGKYNYQQGPQSSLSHKDFQ
jgi:dCTP deaminase